MELLKSLTNTYGPSGNEEGICDKIISEIKGYIDEYIIDGMGNLVARKKGIGKRLMLCAHTDEIGLMVNFIDDNGFLRFVSVGGIDQYSSLYQRVEFANGICGVVAYEESLKEMKDLTLSKMYIDIGCKSKEEAEKKIKIGDVAIFKGELVRNEKMLISKALDNRIGVYILIDVIKQIKRSPYDLYFVFSSQEELGLRGAKSAAFQISPDIGIAVDVTDTGDTPNCKKMAVSLGKGPAIKIKDSSIVTHGLVKKALEITADENNIKYQYEILESGGTDAGAIQLARSGVMTGAVSIPCRYMHSPCEAVDIDDVNGAINLLIKFLEKDFIYK